MKPANLASSIPSEEQAKIDRQKLLMTGENGQLFQSFCENIYAERVSDKAKAKKLENAWLYCLGLGPGIKASPSKFLSAIKGIIERAKANGVNPKAFQKLRAMADVKKMMRGK